MICYEGLHVMVTDRLIEQGDAVVMEGEVLQIGKRMATIRGVLRREKDGAVLAICQHDKALPTVRPDNEPPSTKL